MLWVAVFCPYFAELFQRPAPCPDVKGRAGLIVVVIACTLSTYHDIFSSSCIIRSQFGLSFLAVSGSVSKLNPLRIVASRSPQTA